MFPQCRPRGVTDPPGFVDNRWLTVVKGAAMASRVKTLMLAMATVATAGAIGYDMQYGGATQPERLADVTIDDLTGVQTTSSAGAVQPGPQAPEVPPLPAFDAGPDFDVAAWRPLPEIQLPSSAPPVTRAQAEACPVDILALPAAGAMVDLSITAPCQEGETVTLFHFGLSVTEVMGPDGRLDTRLPALVETVVVLAEFPDGSGGSVSTTVTSLPFYDRVVLQWQGEAGLQLHAREFGADYFEDGHVWRETPGDLGAAAQGRGGFLVSLGAAGDDPSTARLAEVYSFPTGTAQQSGAIELTIEAETTQANCGQRVEAQTIQHWADRSPEARDLDIQMLGCESIGDFLVLQNLVDNLTISR